MHCLWDISVHEHTVRAVKRAQWLEIDSDFFNTLYNPVTLMCTCIYRVTDIFHQTHLYGRHYSGSEVTVPEELVLRMTGNFAQNH